MSETIAKASGAVLGYIAGDLPGAYLGSVAGEKLYHLAENMKRKASNPSLFTQRKDRKTYTRKKKASKRAKRAAYKQMKKAKKAATKAVKKIVKKTLDCTFPIGTYHKAYVGEMYWNNITPNTQVVWGDMQRNKAHTTPYTQLAMSFSPFAGMRMLDAVSVVYNGKTKAINCENVLNNFPVRNLNVDFSYCSYELELTNNSSYAYDVIIYMGTSKRDQNDSVGEAWDDALYDFPWRQLPQREIIPPTGPPYFEDIYPGKNQINITTSGFKQLELRYNIKAKHFKLLPGHRKRFFTTYKGCIPFHKHLVNGELQNFMKGISQSWIFVAKPCASVYYNPETDTAGKLTGAVGVTQGNNIGQAITCEVKEVYKFLQPETTDDDKEGNAAVTFNDYPFRALGNVYWRQNFIDSKNEYGGGGQIGLTVNPVYAGGASG